jgi:beta-1,4-mannosyltransferase
MKHPRRPSGRIRVLESVAPPGSIVKFIDEIVLHAPGDVEFAYFSWRTALLTRYDVFHVHWPEFLIRHPSRGRAWLRRVLFRLFLFRLSAFGTPVVRTVHNVEPHHEGEASEDRLIARLDQLTRTRVVMSECTPTDWKGRTVLIPHGHFREPFATKERSEKVRGRVLLFGRIRPYKGVIELIRAAEQISDPEVEIRIVGSPTNSMRAEIDAELRKPGRSGAKVTLDLRAIPDDELIREVTASELIALPYRDAGNGNSGAAMLALSLDRPVLTPRSCLMETLAAEVGDAWVRMYEGEINGLKIESGLQHVRSLAQDAAPDFHGRDWPDIAEAYAAAFREARDETHP